MEKHDFKQYKKSKILVNHLEIIIKVVNLSIQGLKRYKAYVPVDKILTVMEEQKRILEVHFEKNKKIKESKGKIV